MASRAVEDRTRAGGWVKMTPAEQRAFSVQGRQTIKEEVDRVIERHVKPSVLKRKGKRASFGDVLDIYTKWRGNNLILMAIRRGDRARGRHAVDFETPSGRLTLIGADSFDVSYYRHTGRWWIIAHDCTLKSALMFFRKPGPLWPW